MLYNLKEDYELKRNPQEETLTFILNTIFIISYI